MYSNVTALCKTASSCSNILDLGITLKDYLLTDWRLKLLTIIFINHNHCTIIFTGKCKSNSMINVHVLTSSSNNYAHCKILDDNYLQVNNSMNSCKRLQGFRHDWKTSRKIQGWPKNPVHNSSYHINATTQDKKKQISPNVWSIQENIHCISIKNNPFDFWS